MFLLNIFVRFPQSRTLGKALSAGGLFGEVSQEARVEGVGKVRQGRQKSQYKSARISKATSRQDF